MFELPKTVLDKLKQSMEQYQAHFMRGHPVCHRASSSGQQSYYQ